MLASLDMTTARTSADQPAVTTTFKRQSFIVIAQCKAWQGRAGRLPSSSNLRLTTVLGSPYYAAQATDGRVSAEIESALIESVLIESALRIPRINTHAAWSDVNTNGNNTNNDFTAPH